MVLKKIKEIEKEYGVDFGVKDTMKLSTYLKKKGFPSLAKLLETKKENKQKICHTKTTTK